MRVHAKKWRRTIPWALLGLAAFLMGPTWPRDDTGVPSAQCSFIGSDGTPTLCSTLSPLPTGAGITTSETDPTGFGKNWFLPSGSLTDANTTGAAVFIGDRSILAWQPSGGSMDASMSLDGGRTFSLISTASVGGDGVAQVNTALRFGGAYLVGGNPGVGPSSNDGLWRSGDGLAAWTAVDLPGFGDGSVVSLHGQGTTVLALANTGVGFVCRSTTSGASFATCTDLGLFGLFGGLGIASPSAGIWLVADSVGTVGRSTDDGATFVSVLAAGSGVTVTCLTATVCLAASGGEVIRRSTDAGATWSVVFTAGLNSDFRALVNFGSGVVTAMGVAGANPPVFRSSDFGATWAFQVALPAAVNSSFYQSAIALNGRGFVFLAHGPTAEAGFYSPIVGAGETIVAGQSGNRWEINAAGEGRTSAVIRDATQANAMGVTVGGRGQVNAVPETGTNTRACSQPAANTAATITVTGVAGQQVHVLSFVAFYTTAPAAAQTLTITDGATTAWLDIVNGANTPTFRDFGFTMEANVGATVTITLPAGGAGVTGRLCAVVAQFPH